MTVCIQPLFVLRTFEVDDTTRFCGHLNACVDTVCNLSVLLSEFFASPERTVSIRWKFKVAI